MGHVLHAAVMIASMSGRNRTMERALIGAGAVAAPVTTSNFFATLMAYHSGKPVCD